MIPAVKMHSLCSLIVLGRSLPLSCAVDRSWAERSEEHILHVNTRLQILFDHDNFASQLSESLLTW